MFLLGIMILWNGGSCFMRMQLWPSVNFWHHVSLLGMFLLPVGYFHFLLDFLEDRSDSGRKMWSVFYFTVFVVNCFTGFFVPLPEDPWAGVLQSLGAGLGRFIYWMDAWEDYDADHRKRRFNPLDGYHDRPDYEDFCKETLELLIAEAANSFEILPLEQDLDLLRNVIYSGVWQRYTLITEKKQKQRKEDAHAE